MPDLTVRVTAIERLAPGQSPGLQLAGIDPVAAESCGRSPNLGSDGPCVFVVLQETAPLPTVCEGGSSLIR